jgi:outer membrane protein assembly factor BamE (lipoprotein component of BamABCDE complex)
VQRKSSRLARQASALALVLALSACAGIAVRGNMPDPEEIAAITAGVDSRRDVAERLGSPSTLSTFQDRKWYYIGQTTRQFAFMKTDVLDRRVLVVTFDDDGRVDQTVVYGMDDGWDIDPVSRITPTEGDDLTVFQQLFGNFGRLPGAVSAE